jgi:hypothetical protein
MSYDFKEAIYNHFKTYQETGVISSPLIANFLENDIYAIMEIQDSEMFKASADIFSWLRENLPTDIWGDQAKVETFQKTKGIGV